MHARTCTSMKCLLVVSLCFGLFVNDLNGALSQHPCMQSCKSIHRGERVLEGTMGIDVGVGSVEESDPILSSSIKDAASACSGGGATVPSQPAPTFCDACEAGNDITMLRFKINAGKESLSNSQPSSTVQGTCHVYACMGASYHALLYTVHVVRCPHAHACFVVTLVPL